MTNDRDAAWEMETDAFNDLLERHSCCDATQCRCPEGRSESILDTLVCIVDSNIVYPHVYVFQCIFVSLGTC